VLLKGRHAASFSRSIHVAKAEDLDKAIVKLSSITMSENIQKRVKSRRWMEVRTKRRERQEEEKCIKIYKEGMSAKMKLLFDSR